MRSGIWTTGSGGSGILIARKTDGTWSPPSALMLHTASLRFVFGVDIYDCVLVINNFTVLEAFGRPRLTLGTDVSLTAGPLVAVGLLENDVTWADLSDRAVVYVKAKGQSAEVKMDGIVVNERAEENERFYGMKISVAKILSGDINQSLPQTRALTEVLKAAEGRNDYDSALIEQLSFHPTPADASHEPNSMAPSPLFGIPDVEDPDPFGVLALEMAGMGIREAGTRLRPDSTQFEFNPSPTSPFFPKGSRRSMDTYLSRSNRGSYMSNKTMATERSQMTDAGTQTYFVTPQTTPSSSQSQSEDGSQPEKTEDVPEVKEPIEIDYTKIDISALRSLSNFPDLDDKPPTTTMAIQEEDEEDEDDEEDVEVEEEAEEGEEESESEMEDDMGISTEDAETTTGTYPEAVHDATENEALDEDNAEDNADDSEGEVEGEAEENGDESDAEEEAVVFEVAMAKAPARLTIGASRVNIPARVAPPVPVRSPARASLRKSQMSDVNSLISSPLRREFELDAELEEATTPRATEKALARLESTDNKLVEEVEDDLKETGEDTETTERPTTPTPESKSTNMYSPKISNRSSLRETTAAETSPKSDRHVSLKAGPDVSVSVA